MGTDMCFSYNKVFPPLHIYGIILLSQCSAKSATEASGWKAKTFPFPFVSLIAPGKSFLSLRKLGLSSLLLTPTFFERNVTTVVLLHTALHCGLTKADWNFNTLQDQDFSQISGNSTQQKVVFFKPVETKSYPNLMGEKTNCLIS